MTNPPLVTIGLPFYNNEKTLCLAIKSVLLQTFQNWELILVNDGSNDNSLLIAEDIAKKDKRIRIVNDGVNKGLIFRLNQIVNLARGQFIARMDGDDLMTPEKLEKQINFLLNNPQIDIVDTGVYTIDLDGNPVGKRALVDINYDRRHLLLNVMLLHASIVGKKEWFVANPYDDGYERAEDYELWCRTHSRSKFSRIKEPLYIVREGKVNIDNYIKGSRSVRKIIRVYGKGIFPAWKISMEELKSHLKVLLYRSFALFNKQDYLSSKRNQSLTTAEREKVNQIINQISKVSIHFSHERSCNNLLLSIGKE